MLRSVLTASLLAAVCTLASADGIYTKTSPVLQVSSKDFSSLIEQSNHTSIVEFYAPWCGHCQKLKPAYEKAAKSLSGLAKVAAINCDDEANKPLCGRMGVQGFPTLKIFKPGSKKGRPIVEDYQGERTAKAIVDAVSDKIPNHVKKLQDAGLESWLADGGKAKAILFSDKGTTGSLIRALAVDFLGHIDFVQIRNKEKGAVEKYGVEKFPTIVLVPSSAAEPITYEGEMKKDALTAFFTQIAPPNPDPAPKKAKTSSTKKAKEASSESAKASSKFSEASEAHKASEFDEHLQAQTILLGDDMPTESPLPIVEHAEKPMVVKEAATPIPELSTAVEVETACLTPKSGNCILILLPPKDSPDAETHPLAAEALASFAEVAEKYHKRKTNVFPFYAVPAHNEAAKSLRQELDLKSITGLDILAINMKRKWWRPYPASGYDMTDAENFVDAIKLGEGAKQKLSPNFYTSKRTEEPAAPQVEPEPVAENTVVEESATADPSPASTPDVPVHNEL